jgi:hypothetical protein
LFHLGYYLNRYALWYRVEHFTTPTELVQWLKINAYSIDGRIDFIVEK